MTRLLLAAALSTAALSTTALPAAAFDPASMSDADKAAFGQAVRDYLMANPEVLVEAIGELEKRQMADEAKNDAALVQHFRPQLTQDAADWAGGNLQGDLTVVEFIDYRCGVCRQVYGDVEALVKSDGQIRIVFKEFPILGEESEMAARFAIAVRQVAGDEAYKAAHDRLMTLRGRVTMDSLAGVATEIGVDGKAVTDRMNTEAVTAVIRANRQLAEQMKIAGTPAFVIGDQLLRGVPREGLVPVVEAARKAGSAG